MSTSVLDPSQTIQARKKPEVVEPLGGRMGFIDEKEQSLRVPDKTPSMPSHGSIPFKLDVLGEANKIAETAWNSLGALTQDAGEATWDLGKQVLFGPDVANQEASEVAKAAWEKHPITQAEGVAQNAWQQADKAQALKDAQQIRFWLTRVGELNQTISLEDYKQKEKEVHRLNEGTITDQDKKLLGLSRDLNSEHLKSRALLIALGDKKSEIKATTEKQEEQQDQREVQAPKFQMRKGELEMGHENKSHWTQNTG